MNVKYRPHTTVLPSQNSANGTTRDDSFSAPSTMRLLLYMRSATLCSTATTVTVGHDMCFGRLSDML